MKDGVLKEMLRGGFGIFVDFWSICAFCNMDYTSDSSLLDMGNNSIGANSKSSGEACVAITFEKRYPDFLVGHSTLDVAVGTLLPGLYTLDKWSQAGEFGTRHEI